MPVKCDLDQGVEVLDVEENSAHENSEELYGDDEHDVELSDVDAAQFLTSEEVCH